MGTLVEFGNRGKFYFTKREFGRAKAIVDIFREQNRSLNISAVRQLCLERYGKAPSFESVSKTLLLLALASYLKVGQYGRSRNFRLNPRRAKAKS